MATIVIMPRQGQSVESCVITTWNKQVGDTVAEGDVLFSYETDKSSFDEPAKVAGTLLAIFAGEGDDVPCLDPVCAIGEPGEKVEAPAKEGAAPAAEAPKAKEPTDDVKPVERVCVHDLDVPFADEERAVRRRRIRRRVECCLAELWLCVAKSNKPRALLAERSVHGERRGVRQRLAGLDLDAPNAVDPSATRRF